MKPSLVYNRQKTQDVDKTNRKSYVSVVVVVSESSKKAQIVFLELDFALEVRRKASVF